MRDSRQESDHYAQGHPVGEEDQRRTPIVRRYGRKLEKVKESMF